MKFIKKIVYLLFYPFYSYKAIRARLRLKSFVCFNSIKRKFKHIGDHCGMEYPFYIRNPKYVSIGNNFHSERDLKIEVWDCYESQKTDFIPNVMIGNDVTVTNGFHISCVNNVCIGDGALIGPNVFITDNAHGDSINITNVKPLGRFLSSKGGVNIGNNVWIGRNVVILSGVEIGNNCIIGANAVVTKSIEDNSVVAGNPAKVIRRLEENKDV